MEVVFVSFHPIIRSCFSMDQDTAVVGARSQENTKLRMCPTNLPDRSLMTLKSTGVVVDISSDIKYLDCSIRGTSGKFLRIIIKLTVVNHIFVLRFYFNHCCHDLKQQSILKRESGQIRTHFNFYDPIILQNNTATRNNYLLFINNKQKLIIY